MKRKKILALALSVCLVSATGAFAGWEAPVLTGLAEDIVAVDALSPEELTENDVRESAAAVLDAVESADISGTTVLVTKQEVADALAPHAAQLKGMTPDTEGVQRLPVLQVVFSDDSVGEGQAAVTMHKLDSIFNGKKVSELAPVKILGSDAMQVFEQVTAIGAIGDKSYAIVKKPSGCCQSVLGSDDIIGDGAVTDEFYIAVGIARDGDFDLGAEGVQIIDPVLVSSGNPRYMQTAPNFEGIPETVVKVALTKANIPTENVDMAEITELKYKAWLEILDEIVAGEGSVPDILQKLPAFAFQSDIGATTLTGFTLDASEFEGLSVSDISAAVGNTMMMATPLELVVDGVEPATFDGKFAIAVASDEEGLLEILGADAVIDATKQYFVLLGIMDGGEFDAAPAAGVVAAPAFLYSVPEASDVLEGPIVPLISAADLPEDVEIGIAIAPATIADSGLNTDAAATIEELEGSTVLFLKNDVVTSILEEFEDVLDESFSKKAPVFKTTLSEAGKTGLVMFALPASFAGKQSDKIVPVKAVSTTAADALPFEFVDDVADLADGTFAILESDKATFVAEETVLAEDSVHYLLLAIQDGGDYDMNATEAIVSDPFFVGIGVAPTPTPTPTPVPLELVEPLIPVASLADGVEIALNPTLPATVAETGLTETAAGAVETLLGGTHVILKDTVATNLLAYRARSMSPNVKVKVPVFKANVSDTGRTGIVMFVLPTTFAGKKAMDVLPVKAVSETASQSLLYGFTSAVSGLTDGKYAIFGSDRRTPLAGDTTLAAGTTYYIAFAVKDGGAFDKNETAAVIADPCLIGLAEAIGGGSSGGCSAAGFSPAMILLALPLLAVFGRK